MRKLLFLVISIFSLIILFGCSTPEVKKEQQQPSPISEQRELESLRGRINSEQPIAIGETIFTAQVGGVVLGYYRTTTRAYIYLGLDDKNNVRVLHKLDLSWEQPKVETFPLLLPLNDKKQTILRVMGIRGPKRDLLITVVDEFNRITVEEIVKNQTK